MNQAIAGGWEPIGNIGDIRYIRMANFAVTQYDRQVGAKLAFERLNKVEYQVAAARQYFRLHLSAKNGPFSNNYEAIVWLPQLSLVLHLDSFKRI
ncbi:unnamed protein product [Vicia faba]|uniref:Cystatin domain-containing protein n=1 Tax=Vicia faba TaxID=3906 RepID=A0AAV0ZVR0_VICFA|nr:unnamed protein product [Vicia faba]